MENPLLRKILINKYSVGADLSTISEESTIARFTISSFHCIYKMLLQPNLRSTLMNKKLDHFEIITVVRGHKYISDKEEKNVSH